MKIQKKIAAIIAGSMLALTVSAGLAIAAYCNDSTVNRVAVKPDIAVPGSVSKYQVTLTCNDTNHASWTGTKSFYLIEDIGDSGYATLLTGLSLGNGVVVRMGSYNWYSLITQIELNN